MYYFQTEGATERRTFEKVLNEMYLAMVAPCMVMTCYMLPKQFWAYDGNEKQNYYMYNYADLLIVDEAGQISPEIGKRNNIIKS